MLVNHIVCEMRYCPLSFADGPALTGRITVKDIAKDFTSIINKYKTALDSFSSMYRTGAITDTQVVVHQLESLARQIRETPRFPSLCSYSSLSQVPK